MWVVKNMKLRPPRPPPLLVVPTGFMEFGQKRRGHICTADAKNRLSTYYTVGHHLVVACDDPGQRTNTFAPRVGDHDHAVLVEIASG